MKERAAEGPWGFSVHYILAPLGAVGTPEGAYLPSSGDPMEEGRLPTERRTGPLMVYTSHLNRLAVVTGLATIFVSIPEDHGAGAGSEVR